MQEVKGGGSGYLSVQLSPFARTTGEEKPQDPPSPPSEQMDLSSLYRILPSDQNLQENHAQTEGQPDTAGNSLWDFVSKWK